jgi:hypothetical protein
MPEALSSFLVSVSVIVAAAFFIPCIESLVRILRRNAQHSSSRPRIPVAAAQPKPAKSYRREAA